MNSHFLIGRRPYAVATPAAPVPLAGAELLTNGDFAAWTGDNPDNWSVFGESGSDPMVTEVAQKARYYSSGATLFLYRTISVAGWIQIVAEWTIASGIPNFLKEGTPWNAAPVSGVPTTGLWSENWFGFGKTSTAADVTYSLASAKHLNLSSLISTRLYAHADIDISVAVTRTAGTQAGIAGRVDDPANPANFLIAYLDGAGNVKLDKCVGGTYTNLVSGAVTYGAAKLLRLRCSGTSVSVYYDGTQVGTTQTVSDAGIMNNLYHGLFSTYASNSFASYTASSWVAVTP